MTFIPPSYARLRINTLNLDKHYSTSLGRYTVIDGKQNDLSQGVQQSSLDVLIARTNSVIECKTHRESQRQVFNQLVNELRQIPKEDEQRVKQGSLFLLGALIHRYFRLIKEYKEFNSYTKMHIWGNSNPIKCHLFLAIRRALQFSDLKELNRMRKKYQEDDLNILDVKTIINALEVFRDNMFMMVEEKTPRYMKYPHFAQDKHFREYLNEIITEQKERGAAVLHRFKAISFLQSLARQIDKEQVQIKNDLLKWCKGIEKDFKDFNEFKTLKEDVINASITHYVESESSRNTLFSLFYSHFIQDGLDSMNPKSFFEQMIECYDNTCSYVLFGGYSLILQQSELFDSKLLFSLQQALDLGRSVKELTCEDSLNGVKFLNKFIANTSSVELDTDFFSGMERMRTTLMGRERELTEELDQLVMSQRKTEYSE